MEIIFDDKKLEEMANNFKLLQKNYGQIGAKLIRRRLDDLKAVKNLEECRKLPGKYHELTTTRSGQIAVHVEEPDRLVFFPNHDPLPLKTDGSLDWSKVTSVRVLEIINYHGK